MSQDPQFLRSLSWTPARTGWETYLSDDPAAEAELFVRLAKRVTAVQERLGARSDQSQNLRALHAKTQIGIANAVLVFNETMPEDLIAGYAQRGRKYPTDVRFSSAGSLCVPDSEMDLRGAAMRIRVDDNEIHDLLMTNFPAPHARDAEELVTLLEIRSGIAGIADVAKAWLFGRGDISAEDLSRVILDARGAAQHQERSLALETYWSRAPILWNGRPVRYLLRPAVIEAAPEPDETDPDFLRRDLKARLTAGEIVFEFCLQRFLDQDQTPVELTRAGVDEKSAAWSGSNPIPVARLVLPQVSDIEAPAQREAERAIDALTFNPWHTTPEFQPLGQLNRARRASYCASAHARHAVDPKGICP